MKNISTIKTEIHYKNKRIGRIKDIIRQYYIDILLRARIPFAIGILLLPLILYILSLLGFIHFSSHNSGFYFILTIITSLLLFFWLFFFFNIKESDLLSSDDDMKTFRGIMTVFIFLGFYLESITFLISEKFNISILIGIALVLFVLYIFSILLIYIYDLKIFNKVSKEGLYGIKKIKRLYKKGDIEGVRKFIERYELFLEFKRGKIQIKQIRNDIKILEQEIHFLRKKEIEKELDKAMPNKSNYHLDKDFKATLSLVDKAASLAQELELLNKQIQIAKKNQLNFKI